VGLDRTVLPGLPEPAFTLKGLARDALRTYSFEWAQDDEQPPYLAKASLSCTAGKEWVRKHAPKQWVEFCAVVLLDMKEVRVVREDDLVKDLQRQLDLKLWGVEVAH